MEQKEEPSRFVSRAGRKLEHALNEFDLDVTDLVCADFGCNVGGFTDCLLQRGAKLVYAVDTAYGVLDYRLRTDGRVVVMERTNALHAEPPTLRPQIPPHPNPLPGGEGLRPPSPSGRGAGGEGEPSRTGERRAAKDKPRTPSGVDLVVIDLGWTPQRRAVPAALRWLRSDATSSIITLIKPHYELREEEKRTLLIDGRLDPAEAERIFHRVLEEMPKLGVTVQASTRSPITGGKSGRRGAGNVEYLALLTPT
ncbi:MAG: SAM-dependent methyltransferase [Planctomycetota bacterium]|nr:SAM-dependent methyltransferase [Planctomycetota bacterium]